ncbi:MAG: hypothetical protein VYD71_01680 [Bacteroidota bacterium]|nr:hypothetical protein [Bacteroidota bacterium]
MKNLLYIFLVAGFLFSACEEEGNPLSPTPTQSFTCKIDGEQLSDSSPSAEILTTNPAINGALEIVAASNLPNGRIMNAITLTIYNFSSITQNTPVFLGLSGQGELQKGIGFWQTSEPNFTGTITFSKITSNKVSGTFSFEARNSDDNTSVSVTEGTFSNVNY